MSVHVVPSLETDAVTACPARTIRTHRGAVPAAAVLTLVPPATERDWNASPLPGVTNIDACGDAGSSDWRIMPPALVQAPTFCTVATLATTVPSPASER